jgi:hypothetical protein
MESTATVFWTRPSFSRFTHAATPRICLTGWTGDEQRAIGLYYGNLSATVSNPLRTCSSPVFGATLVHIVPAGTYNADTNPSRITRRNLFDVALGSNGVLKKDHYSLGGKLTVVNLMNKVALYDFLSSFSGTHFITPRTLEAELTFHF